MARMSIPPTPIELKAHWASDVVSRCVACVLLLTISELYRWSDGHDPRRPSANGRFSTRGPGNRSSSKHSSRRFAPSRCAVLRVVLPPVRSFHHSPMKCGEGKTHLVAHRVVHVLLVSERRSKCWWKIGLADFSFASVPGPVSGRCAGGSNG